MQENLIITAILFMIFASFFVFMALVVVWDENRKEQNKKEEDEKGKLNVFRISFFNKKDQVIQKEMDRIKEVVSFLEKKVSDNEWIEKMNNKISESEKVIVKYSGLKNEEKIFVQPKIEEMLVEIKELFEEKQKEYQDDEVKKILEKFEKKISEVKSI